MNAKNHRESAAPAEEEKNLSDLELSAAENDENSGADNLNINREDEEGKEISPAGISADAFEIDLDQIKFDAEEVEREITDLRAQLKETSEKLKESEAKYTEAAKMSDEYADRFRKAQFQLRAETDEMRARMQRTFEQKLDIARGDVVAKLLDPLDNLQRAIAATENMTDPQAAFEALQGGVRATAELFENQLKKMGLEAVVSEGEIFNPEIHDAVEIAPVPPGQDNLVLAELQRGYKFGDRLLRPARVKVGRAS